MKENKLDDFQRYWESVEDKIVTGRVVLLYVVTKEYDYFEIGYFDSKLWRNQFGFNIKGKVTHWKDLHGPTQCELCGSEKPCYCDPAYDV